jgi:hypothetical protein
VRLLRRANEIVILVSFTPVGTVILVAVVWGTLSMWGVEPPVLWWILAARAAPLLALDLFLFVLRRQRGTGARRIAREITDAVWGEKGRA